MSDCNSDRAESRALMSFATLAAWLLFSGGTAVVIVLLLALVRFAQFAVDAWATGASWPGWVVIGVVSAIVGGRLAIEYADGEL